jgi:multiple antibiotic resistance protein
MFAFEIPLIMQIFVLINPLSSFPFLISAYNNKMNVKTVAIKAVLVAFAVALVVTLFGSYLFNVLGIRVDSFRIAGGIVLLLLGIATVRPKPKENGDTEGINSLITIIATPMLTGPATISFLTIKAHDIGKITVLSNLCWAFLIVGIVFFLFSLCVTRINPKVIDVASRVMGLFLTGVAIEMIAKGVEGLITAVV